MSDAVRWGEFTMTWENEVEMPHGSRAIIPAQWWIKRAGVHVGTAHTLEDARELCLARLRKELEDAELSLAHHEKLEGPKQK